MAELSVRARYLNNPRLASLTALKVTFPLWGVAAPIAAIVGTLTLYFSFVSEGSLSASVISSVAFVGSFYLIFLAGLAAIHWLSHDAVVIDKDGVQLPYSPFQFTRRVLPWSMVASVTVTKPTEQDWHKREITFITTEGKRDFGLSHMEHEDLEKLLLAAEMWCGKTELDSTVIALKDQLGANGGGGKLLSYTDMWEDELGRRFCPTAFIPLEPGRVIRAGSLKVVRHLALGGLSAVYLCQMNDRTMVVLKEAVVSDDSTESSQLKAREMLDREAEMLLKLSHPSIVKVLDHFVEQGRNYLMLEYINGQDLRQLVQQNGSQREGLVLKWALEMATMLKYLHEQDPPIIHRDFTPDNLVLCQDGSIVLIDFGAANEFIGNATGTFVGKHAFIAPEQFRGKAVVQSDIYAFGCTLHFLLTGKEPEALSSSNPKELNPYISSELNDLIVCCTQLEARDRYQSASQMLPVLRGLAASLPSIT